MLLRLFFDFYKNIRGNSIFVCFQVSYVYHFTQNIAAYNMPCLNTRVSRSISKWTQASANRDPIKGKYRKLSKKGRIKSYTE